MPKLNTLGHQCQYCKNTTAVILCFTKWLISIKVATTSQQHPQEQQPLGGTSQEATVKAKIEIVSVYATCPKCGESLLDPETGSHLINVNQYPVTTGFECVGCSNKFTLESKAWR
jgi:hypothetical protein